MMWWLIGCVIGVAVLLVVSFIWSVMTPHVDDCEPEVTHLDFVTTPDEHIKAGERLMEKKSKRFPDAFHGDGGEMMHYER